MIKKPQYLILKAERKLNQNERYEYVRINNNTFKKGGVQPSAIILHEGKKVIVDSYMVRGNVWKLVAPEKRWKFIPYQIAKKLLRESKAGYGVEILHENHNYWKDILTWDDYLISKI